MNQEQLKEILTYDECSGRFYWAKKICDKTVIGSVAGSLSVKEYGKKYWRISIYKKSYKAHRLAWLYVYGRFPANQIDHIDGNGLNNEISNLRDVTKRENGRNQKKNIRNTSGCCGVIWCKDRKKWKPTICSNSGRIYLGIFSDFFEACCARKSAEFKNNYHPNHGSVRRL